MQSYVLSEGEYNELHGLSCRIRLLCNLLEGVGTVELDTEGLFCTLGALQTSIDAALKAVDLRHEVAAYADMQPSHWFGLAKMLSGRGLYRWRDIVEMDERLSRVAQANPAMAPVYQAWREAMTDEGALEMCSRDSTCLDFYAGLVRPLAIQKIEPIDAHDVARMYNVERPEDVAQALADITNRGAVQPRKNAHKATRKRAKAHTAGR